MKGQEVIQPSLFSQKTEKADATYVLFRVAKIWYLYDEKADRDLIDLTAQLEPLAPAQK